MADINSYQNLIDDLYSEITVLSEKKERIEAAKTSFQSIIDNGYNSFITETDSFLSNLDEDDENKDWEGERVSEIREYFQNNIVAQRTLLTVEYAEILNDMSTHILTIQSEIDNAYERIETYRSMMNAIANEETTEDADN